MIRHLFQSRALLAAIILFGLCTTCIVANLRFRGPHVQSDSDNYLARYRPCTKYERGWPSVYHIRFPHGYINPREPLAWDVDPIFEKRSASALAENLLIIIALGATGLLALREAFRSPPPL